LSNWNKYYFLVIDTMRPIKNKFVLLFSPHSEKGGLRLVSISLLAAASFIEKDYDVRIFQSYDKKDYLEALEHLDRAICVGISAMTGYQITDALIFAKLVRSKNSRIPIVWGGVHGTINPAQTAQSPFVDIVVKGQGEETFAELVRALDQGKPIDKILGITYKKEGRVINNPDRPYKSINEFPPIPYHVLGDTINKYIKKNAYADRNLIYLTSAGCPFRCRFCYLGNPSFERAYDPYPAERVIREVKKLVENYHITGIEMRDSNFFVNEKRCRDIFLGLIKEGIKLKISVLNGRVDQLANFDDSFWELMSRIGVAQLLVGAESGDQEMLDYVDKKIRVEDIIECEKKARKVGITITNSFMTGFPIKKENLAASNKQLKKELNSTIDLIIRLLKINPLDDIHVFFYTPYPGSYLYEESIKAGFKEPQSLEEWGEINLHAVTVPWVTNAHKKKVLFLRQLLLLKKLSCGEYFDKKAGTSKKIYWLKKIKINKILEKFIDFRLHFKFFYFPVEKLIFSSIKLLKE